MDQPCNYCSKPVQDQVFKAQSLVTEHSAEPARRLSAETTAPLTALPLHQTQSAPAKDIELRPLPGPANNNSDGVNPASTTETHHGNLELMSRRDTTPEAPADAATVLPTFLEPYRNRFRLMLTCATALAEGMSDSAAGALIPYMEASRSSLSGRPSASSSPPCSSTACGRPSGTRARSAAVAVSIVGVLLGPVYPCAMSSFLRGMSHMESLSDMGTISAFGSMGGAVWPFIVGLLAQAVDTWVLHPIVIVAFIGMLLCWYGIPDEKRRSE
ncbi:hypothetical protein MY10362_002483 [Beauveria mimosiformis]